MAYSLNLNLSKTIKAVDSGYIFSQSQPTNPTPEMLFQINHLPLIQNQHSLFPQLSTKIIEVVYSHIKSLDILYKLTQGLLKAYFSLSMLKSLSLNLITVVLTRELDYNMMQ